jgi:cadmium resistance protein CadD (predicted permease)
MSGGFMRPEAAAILRRWREPLIALAVIALGLWIAARPGRSFRVSAGFWRPSARPR